MRGFAIATLAAVTVLVGGPSASLAVDTSAIADLTVSWRIWQDADLDAALDSGEQVDSSGLTANWNLSTERSLSVSGGSIRTDLGSSSGYEVLSAINTGVGGSAGLGSAHASAAGGLNTLTLRSNVRVTAGAADAFFDSFNAASGAANLIFQLTALGAFSSLGGSADAPLYPSVLVDAYDLDHDVGCAIGFCQGSSSVSISISGRAGRES